MAVNQKQEQSLAPKPVTVSSTSSLETAGSARNDASVITSRPIREAALPTIPASSSQMSLSANTVSQGTNPVFPTSISLVPRPTHLHISRHGGAVVPSSPNPITNTVPEFLYQLTKMLTDNNRDVIEWSNGE